MRGAPRQRAGGPVEYAFVAWPQEETSPGSVDPKNRLRSEPPTSAMNCLNLEIVDPRRRHVPLLSLLIGIFLLTGGCAGNPSNEKDPEIADETSPYVPLALPDRDPTGYFLTKIDDLMRVWSTANHDARNEKDRELVHAIADQINQEVWKYQAELIETLASGPPRGREVAAAALGFVRGPEALSPLMNALSDPEPAVVEKALLGLGVLADEATPLDPLLFHMRTNPEPRTRVNAAYAVYRIVIAGGRSAAVGPACREGLLDPEWAVPTQCAGILGVLGDVEAIGPLGDVLLHEAAVPCQSATVALVRIVGRNESTRGRVARMLVDSIPRMKPSHHRLVFEGLTTLSGQEYVEDLDHWRSWAYGLR